MRREWGRKVMFFFFGKKKDKANGWPQWVVKTDEERIQNLTHQIQDFCQEKWIATEKIDGSSTTFTMKGHGRKRVFHICSRNVVFDTPDKNCYYDTNIYCEMAEKYNIKEVLTRILDSNSNLEFVTLQGETYGEGVQKRTYGLKEHKFMAFNLIYGFKDGTVKRDNPQLMTDTLSQFDVPCVPIVGEIELPNTCEGILELAGGASAIDGELREGLVFRSLDGVRSFKAVDNNFLIKYHQ
jgi:RNA ligase (TIGR02306 family)